MKSIIIFFDKLEDRVRHWLSRRRILYGFMGGTGVVLFWRGVWHTADYLSARFGFLSAGASTVALSELWDGLLSLAFGSVLLLMTGLFVSTFIGNEIIISGLKREKKFAEKGESEVKTDEERFRDIRRELDALKHLIKHGK